MNKCFSSRITQSFFNGSIFMPLFRIRVTTLVQRPAISYDRFAQNITRWNNSRGGCKSPTYAFVSFCLDMMNTILFEIPDNLKPHCQHCERSKQSYNPPSKTFTGFPLNTEYSSKYCYLVVKASMVRVQLYLASMLEEYRLSHHLHPADQSRLKEILSQIKSMGRAFSVAIII